MYEASITYKSGSEDEFGYDEKFDTIQEAVNWLERKALGHTFVGTWINNRRVTLANGTVLANDGLPLCTNPEWHSLYASLDYPRITPKE